MNKWQESQSLHAYEQINISSTMTAGTVRRCKFQGNKRQAANVKKVILFRRKGVRTLSLLLCAFLCISTNVAANRVDMTEEYTRRGTFSPRISLPAINNTTRKHGVSSSGKLIEIIINGLSVFSQDRGTAWTNISTSSTSQRETGLANIASTLTLPGLNSTLQFYNSLERSIHSRSDLSASNDHYRNYLFNSSSGDKGGDLRIGGSFQPYMGRVQVFMPAAKKWGTICGDGWDVRDATVVCRQLGFRVGGVIARPQMEFGRKGPIVLSKVNCRGHEASIDECPSVKWNGTHSLECEEKLRAAGLICGCPLDVSTRVQTQCHLSTRFPSDNLICKHSCLSNQVLIGDSHRECISQQQWSGRKPQCVELFTRNQRKICQISPTKRMPCLQADYNRTNRFNASLANACISMGCCYDYRAPSESPRCFLSTESLCTKNPCKNGGKCRDLYKNNISSYECECVDPYNGRNCQFRRSWMCGKSETPLRRTRPQLKIFGGDTAENGSWPWIVQLRGNDTIFCAGTLIAPQWVLTAAHCLRRRYIDNGPMNDTYWTVVIGQQSRVGHDITSQSVYIEHILSENYSNNFITKKDIALLKLSRPIKTDDYSGMICLPTTRYEQPTPGSKCWIAGWGYITNSHNLPQYLQQANVPVLSNDQCKKLKAYRLIEENMICAGYQHGAVDACEGDSGGPLMCPRTDGTWYLAGIVSWGYNCAEAESPGVYTRVSHYLNWIYEAMHNH